MTGFQDYHDYLLDAMVQWKRDAPELPMERSPPWKGSGIIRMCPDVMSLTHYVFFVKDPQDVVDVKYDTGVAYQIVERLSSAGTHEVGETEAQAIISALQPMTVDTLNEEADALQRSIKELANIDVEVHGAIRMIRTTPIRASQVIATFEVPIGDYRHFPTPQIAAFLAPYPSTPKTLGNNSFRGSRFSRLRLLCSMSSTSNSYLSVKSPPHFALIFHFLLLGISCLWS